MARTELATRLLLVDDDELFCLALGDLLGSEDVEVVTAHSLAEARGHDPNDFDLVVVDDRLPDGRGLSLFSEPMSRTRMVLISAAPELDTAIAALRQHALDYFCKPIDLDRLRSLLAGIRTQIQPPRAAKLDPLDEREPAVELIGSSRSMRALRSTLEHAAASKASVLLTGETGTGKSLAARWLHARSSRAGGPFIALNCASLPESLVESELFGSERGAYTGASVRRQGLIESAADGTLFLDEIGDMPLAAQAKLLDVLETRQVRRLGATRSLRIDIQIIAATNIDLEDACAQARFRRDLLYRLDVLRIELPPLRERNDDLGALVTWLLGQQGSSNRALASGEIDRLRAHDWPGNIRELRNLLERACVLQPSGPLEPSRWLSARARASSSSSSTTAIDSPARVDELVMQHMIEIVARCSTRKQAAAELGIGESTLRRKLKQAERLGLWNASAVASASERSHERG